MLFEVFTRRRSIIDIFGDQYYVVQALGISSRFVEEIVKKYEEKDRERRASLPYWVRNLACAAA